MADILHKKGILSHEEVAAIVDAFENSTVTTVKVDDRVFEPEKYSRLQTFKPTTV